MVMPVIRKICAAAKAGAKKVIKSNVPALWYFGSRQWLRVRRDRGRQGELKSRTLAEGAGGPQSSTMRLND
jgi:hypothetical protein